MKDTKYLLLSTKHSPGYGGYALWWGPNESGYYAAFEAAGRYTHEEAQNIVEMCRGDVIAIPEVDALKLAYTVVEYDYRLREMEDSK